MQIIIGISVIILGAITVPPDPVETNIAPGSIVVPPPRGATPAAQPPARPASVPVPAEPLLTVSLTDGSKLIGTTTLKALTLRSEALGRLSVPLERIASVKFSKDRESVTVTLHNADRLQASLADTTLALATIFGPVTVPLDKATELQVRAGGAGCAVEWEALDFPQDSDWPAARGEPARIADEEIVLRGYPIRTRQALTGPVTLECELTADVGRTGAALWIHLIAENANSQLNPPPDSTIVELSCQVPAGRAGVVSIGRERFERQRFPFQNATQPYQLTVEVLTDKVRVKLGDEVFVVDGVKPPAERFHIRLMGWQPTNTWRVRNVRVK